MCKSINSKIRNVGGGLISFILYNNTDNYLN